MTDAAPRYVLEHAHRVGPGDRGITFHTFRGSGPGGQKKNKTSSAVRAVHDATGISAVAAEHREQPRNRDLALQRLRFQLTLQLRQRLFLDRLEPPAGFSPTRMHLHRNHPDYLITLGYVLDVLAAAGWVVRDAAEALGTTTARVADLVTSDPAIVAYVNRMRGGVGLKPLRRS